MSIYTTPVLNINLKKLIENYKQLMTMSTPAIPSAVVKDDAYGIGAKIVAQTLYKKAHCRHFFVAHAKEGADIRPYAPDATIYVLQGIGADTRTLFERNNLTPVISSPEMLKFWQQYKIDGIKPAIQIETGLNRLGFRKEELEELFIDTTIKQKTENTSSVILEAQQNYSYRSSSEHDENTSPVILEARRQSLHIGDPQTILSRSSSERDVSHSIPGIHKQNIEDVATSYDGDLAHPQFKTESEALPRVR